MAPHEVLGVRPGATRREVTEAFRRYALRHHPDRGGDPSAFEAGVDAYRQLAGGGAQRRSVPMPRGDVVFHRRRRPGIPSLLRAARHRLSGSRNLS